MIYDGDATNQAECGGGTPTERAVAETEKRLRETCRRSACFDELLAACEASLWIVDHVYPSGPNTYATRETLRTAIARAKGGV